MVDQLDIVTFTNENEEMTTGQVMSGQLWGSDDDYAWLYVVTPDGEEYLIPEDEILSARPMGAEAAGI